MSDSPVVQRDECSEIVSSRVGCRRRIDGMSELLVVRQLCMDSVSSLYGIGKCCFEGRMTVSDEGQRCTDDEWMVYIMRQWICGNT